MDRGSFSVEVILALLAFKCLYPRHMHLARGNHESQGMNKIYGFEGEVRALTNPHAFPAQSLLPINLGRGDVRSKRWTVLAAQHLTI